MGAVSSTSENQKSWGVWLAQSVEHVTLDLGVVSSSPTLDVEITYKKVILLIAFKKRKKEKSS